MQPFQPQGRALLIGSLPLKDHHAAFRMVYDHTPDIPLWVQLPVFKEEGMMVQFLSGLPGLTRKGGDYHIDTAKETFDDELLRFYEAYMSIAEEGQDLNSSIFALSPDTAGGFFVFLEQLGSRMPAPVAVKGQITGPITLATGMKDQNGRSVFYNEQMRDVVVKLIAQKARWQIKQLGQFDLPIILFFDEPALAGFGSSAFISITPEEISECFQEVIEAVHSEGGLAGIHVCANTEWSLILNSPADIVSFDAYAYFDKFLLYPDRITTFINRGGIIAWGIVPTSRAEDIEQETSDALASRWETQSDTLVGLGIDKNRLFSQSLITPSCGTGSLSEALAKRVLELTRDVSGKIRSRFLPSQAAATSDCSIR